MMMLTSIASSLPVVTIATINPPLGVTACLRLVSVCDQGPGWRGPIGGLGTPALPRAVIPRNPQKSQVSPHSPCTESASGALLSPWGEENLSGGTVPYPPPPASDPQEGVTRLQLGNLDGGGGGYGIGSPHADGRKRIGCAHY